VSAHSILSKNIIFCQPVLIRENPSSPPFAKGRNNPPSLAKRGKGRFFNDAFLMLFLE